MNQIDWYSVFFYIFIIVFVTVFSIPVGLKYSKSNKLIVIIFWIMSFIIAWIPASIRYGIGTDYFNYVEKYYVITNSKIKFSQIIDIREIAYNILNHIVKFIFDNPQYIFVITSFIVLAIFYKTIYYFRNYISVGLSIFIFMTMFYFRSYNIIRQLIALSIVFYSYKYLLNRDNMKFIFCIIIAGLFHLTALFFAPIYLVLGQEKHKKLKIFGFILIIILCYAYYENFLGYLTSFQIFEKYSVYALNKSYGIGKIAIRLPIFIPLMYYRKKIINYNKQFETLYYLIIIEMFLSLSSYISIYIDRISLYYSVSYILLLSALPKIFKRSYPIYIYIIIYGAIYWLYFFVYKMQDGIIPYKYIFPF